MAVAINGYSPYMAFQQSYQYPTFQSGYPSQPIHNNYNNYYTQQQQSPVQSYQMPTQSQQTPAQSYQMPTQSQQTPAQSYQMPVRAQQAPKQMPVQSQQPQPRQQPQPQPQPQVRQALPAIEYVDSGERPLRARREPRIIRQVILLPTPEPIYRQVRHRMPTPERQVIQRTIIQKANGEVVVQQQRPGKTRSQSVQDPHPQTRSSRSRQVYTD